MVFPICFCSSMTVYRFYYFVHCVISLYIIFRSPTNKIMSMPIVFNQEKRNENTDYVSCMLRAFLSYLFHTIPRINDGVFLTINPYSFSSNGVEYYWWDIFIPTKNTSGTYVVPYPQEVWGLRENSETYRIPYLHPIEAKISGERVKTQNIVRKY